MLQTIREHTHGWIAGIIIGLIILSFALWGIHSYFTGEPSNTVVAKVNGEEITREQFTVAYERLRRQMQVQYGSTPTSPKDETVLKTRALQALIDIEVLKQASEAQDFRISNRQVDNYLQNMPEFQVEGRFSVERFQEILSSGLLSTGEFLDLIKTSLLIDQPKLGILFTSFSLPDETQYTIGLVDQERDIEYLSLPLSFFLSKPIIIPPEQIQAYYNDHKNEFMTPEQVNVDYLELSLQDLSKKINPTDAMLKNFYNETINTYTQPTAWKLEAIQIPIAANSPDGMAQAKNKADVALQAILNGESFTKIAQEYSKAKQSSLFNSQNWLTLVQIPAELQKAVSEQTKVDQVFGPIQVNNSFVIIRVLDIKEPKIQDFDAVKNKVREAYVHQHAEEKFAEMRDRLADMTYEHPESLQVAARGLNLPVKTSELFIRDKAGADISQYKKVRDVAFSHDVLTLQNNSDVIQINPETVIVIRVKSHSPSSLLPLKDISKQIEEKLKITAAETQAAKFAENIQQKLKAGADAMHIATENKLTWNKTGYTGRYSTKVDPAILDAAFRLPNPNGKTIYGMTRLPNGYAIVAVKGVKQGAVTDEKKFAVFAEQVQMSEGLLEYELYKQSQVNKATIKIES